MSFFFFFFGLAGRLNFFFPVVHNFSAWYDLMKSSFPSLIKTISILYIVIYYVQYKIWKDKMYTIKKSMNQIGLCSCSKPILLENFRPYCMAIFFFWFVISILWFYYIFHFDFSFYILTKIFRWTFITLIIGVKNRVWIYIFLSFERTFFLHPLYYHNRLHVLRPFIIFTEP